MQHFIPILGLNSFKRKPKQGKVIQHLPIYQVIFLLTKCFVLLFLAANKNVLMPYVWLFPDSSLLTTFGVIGSALKTCCVRYRYVSGDVSSWLDHAKEYHGGRYSETQVESTKSLARLFPLFAFQILYRTCIMQVSKQLFKPNLKKKTVYYHFTWFLTVALPTEPPCRIVFISSNN